MFEMDETSRSLKPQTTVLRLSDILRQNGRSGKENDKTERKNIS